MPTSSSAVPALLRVTVSGARGRDPDPVWWPKQAMRFKKTELVELLTYRPGG